MRPTFSSARVASRSATLLLYLPVSASTTALTSRSMSTTGPPALASFFTRVTALARLLACSFSLTSFAMRPYSAEARNSGRNARMLSARYRW